MKVGKNQGSQLPSAEQVAEGVSEPQRTQLGATGWTSADALEATRQRALGLQQKYLPPAKGDVPTAQEPVLRPMYGVIAPPEDNDPVIAPMYGVIAPPEDSDPVIRPMYGVIGPPEDSDPVIRPMYGVIAPPEDRDQDPVIRPLYGVVAPSE